MKEQTLVFWCSDNCQMSLYMPMAMEKMTMSGMRKFLKYVKQEFWQNEDNLREFFTYISEIEQTLENDWKTALSTCEKETLDTKYDEKGNRITDKTERQKRAAYNKKLLEAVKRAKSRYQAFQRRIPELKKMREEMRMNAQ